MLDRLDPRLQSACCAQQRIDIDWLCDHCLLETGQGFLIQAPPIFGRPGAQLLVQALWDVLQGNARHATILQPKWLHCVRPLEEGLGKRLEVVGIAGQPAALREIGLAAAFAAEFRGEQLQN